MAESPASRLRRAIELELPSIPFDKAVIDYFADAWRVSQSEADVVDAWNPFLISLGVVQDDDAAGEVCRAVLRRLELEEKAQGEQPADGSSAAREEQQAPIGEVRGLTAWLEAQKLQKYAVPAREWCAGSGASCIEDILKQSDKFCADLGLKVLQERRVKKDADALSQGGALPSATSEIRRIPPQQQSAQKAAELIKEAEAQGLEIIGPAQSDTRYIVTGELGSGATACVKKCIRSTATSQQEAPLAVKMIPLARSRMNADPSRALARVHREIQNMKPLDHRHVVKLFDSWETPEMLYVVMELVEGGELLNAITDRRGLREPEARHVFMQLVEALEYIHSKNVIHRDLKPENILVNTKNERDGLTLMTVKISDFGASKLVDDGNEGALTQVGTPQYWAPEVSDPRTAAMGYDERVDLWSLGVVLYVMLEGMWPFQGERMDENVRKANFSFKDASKTSQEARDLIRKLIQVKPQDRLPLAKCMKHTWVASTTR